jgi:hypothetical protein
LYSRQEILERVALDRRLCRMADFTS